MTTPQTNLHILPSNDKSKKKEKKQKKKNHGNEAKNKSYQAIRVSPRAINTTQSNETVSPIEIFSLGTNLEEMLELIVEQSNLYAH